ncbi:MAG TPA: M23 family metallopeptidase [Edaphobacter sp.]|nr:M23 family metallopeptidase [Edaphobacter sp.]
MPVLTRIFFAWIMLPIVFAMAGAGRVMAHAHEQMTPVLLHVEDGPVPFVGTDGRMHLVYELWMTNFSSGDTKVEKIEVLADGKVIASLDAAAVAQRLQPDGKRNAVDKLGASEQALLFLHVILPPGAAAPQRLSHRVSIHAEAAPPGQQEITENGGDTKVNHQAVALIAPPLRGEGYISADSCCDATRHTRAAIPINGRVWIAQRYAVDWEQIDGQGRIYDGAREKLESYTIFGKPVLAVTDGLVIAVIDGLPEQTPGKYPANIPLDEADGNSVILDLGQQRYAMYAHMKTGSVKVHRGEQVKVGQVIGLVGNTGNSVAPHLHFQVTGGPSSLASNGLPYEIRSFDVAGKTPGTQAFDEAEEKGTPLAVTPMKPAREVTGAFPLDQLIVSFAAR